MMGWMDRMKGGEIDGERFRDGSRGGRERELEALLRQVVSVVPLGLTGGECVASNTVE